MRLVLILCLMVFSAPSQAQEGSQLEGLQRSYDEIRREATRLAGEPMDIPQRSMFLYRIYLESAKNHTFPLIALHGALWALRHFGKTGYIANLTRVRYFYNEIELNRRLQMLHNFSFAFQKINRDVFIDTYTNFYFSKRHQGASETERILNPELLTALNKIHRATQNREILDENQKFNLFKSSLIFEQEITVTPGVNAAVLGFDCPILKALALKPVVRFKYFPQDDFLYFASFSDQAERIQKAISSYQKAQQSGWQRVEDSIKEYDSPIPAEFFKDPIGYTDILKLRL